MSDDSGVDASLLAERWIALGKVGRPYGLSGALFLHSYSTEAETLLAARTLRIKGHDYDVQHIKRHGERIVGSLQGIATPEAAAALTNAEFSVARASFPELPAGQFYWVDLVGLDCYCDERYFGVVTEVFEAGAHPILRVRAPDATRDELIPYVDAIVKQVDLAARRIEVDWLGLE